MRVAIVTESPLDLVEHGRTGLLYDHADRRSLRRAIATLVGDPDLRDALATKALQRVGERGWANVVDELVDPHYSAVLSHAGVSMAA